MENTRRKTDSDINCSCRTQGEFNPLGEIIACQLDQLFGNILAEVKKADVSDYEPSNVRGFMSSLVRHLKIHHLSYQVNKEEQLPHSDNSLKANMSYLKSQGHSHGADGLIVIYIDRLFNANQLGHDTPVQIIILLHISFFLLFWMRDRVKQGELKWGDIE